MSRDDLVPTTVPWHGSARRLSRRGTASPYDGSWRPSNRSFRGSIRHPWHYLRDVLDKLSQGWPHSRLDELLPLAWHTAHPQY